jgi:hypothetical protein
MAEYVFAARSNYFNVKDRAAFDTLAKQLHLLVLDSEKHPGKVGIAIEIGDGWSLFDDGGNQIDVLAALAPHLAEGEVAVLMEGGFVKLQAVNGYAAAVHSDGRTVELHVDQIYALAAQAFGVSEESITKAFD